MNEERQCRRAPQGFLAVALLIMLFGAMDASAQRFQYAYGSANCTETGLHGVRQRNAGGYVAVGESFAGAGGACGVANAYVVATNAAGAQLWSITYQIGTSSHATDVVELANGDLIVCGYATIAAPCNVGGISEDIFLLHLTAAGGIVAVNTYGGLQTDEQAWKLVRATVGDGVTTFPGDYVVAGWSTNQNAAGMRGGYLLRMNAGLGLIWDQQYGQAATDDYFLALDEVPTGLVGAGDIVAVGGSTSPPAVNRDVFVARVNGNNGTIGAAPQGESLTNYPPAANGSIEEGRGVVVLRNGPNAGDIVITGNTNGAPMPSVSDEVFMLELGPNPCTFVAALHFGDNGQLPDRGHNLVEDATPPAGVASDVVVTGFTNIAGGFGLEDVFLQRVSTGPGMALVGQAGDFGGTGNDRGNAVANAVRVVANSETRGYIVNGYTQSNNLIGAVDPQQLYLIKTGTGLRSFCNDVLLQFPSALVENGTACVQMIGPNIGLQCQPNIGSIQWQWANQLCYAFPKLVPEDIEGAGDASMISFNEGRMTTYPNPSRSGDMVNLRFDLNAPAAAHVVISDIIGREVYRHDLSLVKGVQQVSVGTDGWPAGTYLARVTIGGVTATSSMVVLEK